MVTNTRCFENVRFEAEELKNRFFRPEIFPCLSCLLEIFLEEGSPQSQQLIGEPLRLGICEKYLTVICGRDNRGAYPDLC